MLGHQHDLHAAARVRESQLPMAPRVRENLRRGREMSRRELIALGINLADSLEAFGAALRVWGCLRILS